MCRSAARPRLIGRGDRRSSAVNRLPTPLSLALNRLTLGHAQREHFQKILDDISAIDQVKTSGGDLPLRLPVEAGAICPMDPRLPNIGEDPAPGSLRPDVFEQADKAAGLDHASKLAKRGHL